MAVVTQSAASQSSAALNGQSTSYLAGLVSQQCAGAPDALVNTQLQLTLREFYTNSTAWRRVLGPYAVNANVNTIQLNPVDQYSAIMLVLDGWFFPIPGGSTNAKQRIQWAQRQIIGTDVGPPVYGWMQDLDHIVLYPVPNTSYGNSLYIYAAMRPVINSTQLPTMATEDHLDALVYGTLARLLRIPKRPWSNMQLSQEYTRMFKREISVWRDIANRGYGPADTSISFPQFAGRGSQRAFRSF